MFIFNRSVKTYADQATPHFCLLTDSIKTGKWKWKCIHKCCFGKNSTNDACHRSDEKKYEILKLKEVYACLGLKASLNSAAVTCMVQSLHAEQNHQSENNIGSPVHLENLDTRSI